MQKLQTWLILVMFSCFTPFVDCATRVWFEILQMTPFFYLTIRKSVGNQITRDHLPGVDIPESGRDNGEERQGGDCRRTIARCFIYIVKAVVSAATSFTRWGQAQANRPAVTTKIESREARRMKCAR